MTEENPSRGATLADVLVTISSADLASRQKDDLSSAVRTIARLLDAKPEGVAADPRLLAMRLKNISPQMAGISSGRLANAKSLLRRGLSLHRPMLPGRSITPMSEQWTELYRRLPSRAHQLRLSRLLRWLSAGHIAPCDVTIGKLAVFEGELRQNALMTKHDDAWRDTVWAWNSARKAIEGWPALELTVPRRQQTYTLPWTTFPQSLVADAHAYLDHISGRDPLNPLPFPPVKRSTRETRERQLRTFASVVVHQGVPADRVRALSDLVAIDHFRLGLRWFLERHHKQTSSMIGQMAGFLKGVAEHWVKVSPEHLSEIAAIAAKLAPGRRGMTPKNRARLRPFDDPENLAALLHLPKKLIEVASSSRYSAKRSAVIAQTAVAIELLIMRPVRLNNLRTLDLNRNFLRPRRGGFVHVLISASEVKNGQDLEHRLPPESAALLELYLKRYRPLLCSAENRKLFPGQTPGSCKSMGSLRIQIKRAISRYTGLQMHPHLFRHFAAKLHLDQNPGEYAVVSKVLGHRDINTTSRFYAGSEIDAAVRHYDSTVQRLRAASEKSGNRRTPRGVPKPLKKVA